MFRLSFSGGHICWSPYTVATRLLASAGPVVQPFLYGLQMLCCTMRCQWGKKTPKIAPFPWDFVTLLEEDRATAIGNMHKKIW